MTRDCISRFVNCDRGSSAVEFAIIFPLLLMILFGIIDFGRLNFERIQVTSAAYEGARASGFKVAYTAANPQLGKDAITAAVNAAAGGLVVTVDFTASTNVDCLTPGAETTIVVRRPSTFKWYTPMLQGFTTTVTSTGAFRCFG